ncbi:MAG: 3-keto-5-aminohexanoate cleavage protein [Flavonifractor plautii]
MAKTIITAALTGAVTPAGYKIPETPQQIADEAYDAWKLGAAVVHLHMRADDGLGAMDNGEVPRDHAGSSAATRTAT